MICPKCSTNMKILDYNDKFNDIWATYEWECKCPNCDYHGKYREFFKLTDSEWERMNE